MLTIIIVVIIVVIIILVKRVKNYIKKSNCDKVKNNIQQPIQNINTKCDKDKKTYSLLKNIQIKMLQSQKEHELIYYILNVTTPKTQILVK